MMVWELGPGRARRPARTGVISEFREDMTVGREMLLGRWVWETERRAHVPLRKGRRRSDHYRKLRCTLKLIPSASDSAEFGMRRFDARDQESAREC